MAETEAVSEADDSHTHERACLNCGCALVGDFCHCCGQRAHVHRTLGAFWHDLAHGVLHFEGKLWHTLPLLAWRPGELTRRYIDGQRARFISPIALFLFAVFMMFAVLTATGTLVTTPQGRADISRSLAETEQTVARLDRERQAAAAAGVPTADLDSRLAEARTELAALNGLSGRNIQVARNVQMSGDMPGWLRRPIEKAGSNPELLLYKLRTNAYKFSWLLIPLSVPLLWLLFPLSRRFTLNDHAVFVTYSLAFMTLLVVAAVLVGMVTPAVAGMAMLIPPIHMYRQLRGTYELTRAGAIWRTVLLTVFAMAATLLFLVLLVGLGLFD
ncbi:DUF3667 domain-containing protein [Sphingomonas sp.]|uniref:DUF3667 domain-containing protein n=1 Tax=Sphingomonas sp. TaxID=28214 RepID=UPI00286E9467|nr:DUF3667 domain-containing protein [Sphingomonas sp.]